jgi:hypothetical protein
MERCGEWVSTGMAKWAPDTGSTFQMFYLTSTAGPLPDLNNFNQVWVVDLSSNGPQGDESPSQLVAYTAIANWWLNRGKPHVILDGRIISSCWKFDSVIDRSLLENYFVNLRIRGGGLFLGTDHDVFQSGINDILRKMQVTEFCCVFAVAPYKMKADNENPLLNYPQRAYYDDGDDVTGSFLQLALPPAYF